MSIYLPGLSQKKFLSRYVLYLVAISLKVNVLQVMIWGFGGCWRFLTGSEYLKLDLYMTNVLWYTNFQILSLYLDFEGARNIHEILSPDLGLWRILWFLTGVLDHDLDYDMATGLWYNYVPNWCSLSWFSLCQGYQCSLSPNLGLWMMPGFRALDDAGGSWLGVWILILIMIWSLNFDTSIFQITWSKCWAKPQTGRTERFAFQ